MTSSQLKEAMIDNSLFFQTAGTVAGVDDGYAAVCTKRLP